MAAQEKSATPLSEEALPLVAARFRALADPSRLHLLASLMAGERSVQDLVDSTGLSQTNVSRHLGVLRREGIVARRREGSRALYRIVDPSVVKLCQLACGGLTGRLAQDLEALPEARDWRGYGI